MERRYLTVKEAAAVAKVNPHTVRRWQWDGKLSHYKIEGRVLVDEAELMARISPSPVVTGAGA